MKTKSSGDIKKPIIYRCKDCDGITAFYNYEIRTGDIMCKCHKALKTTQVNYDTSIDTCMNTSGKKYKLVYSTKKQKQ